MSYLPGINIQAPWATQIVNGRKVIETRHYPLPKHFENRKVAIIETPGSIGEFQARIVGIVVFGPSFQYEDAEAFYADSARHLVTPETPLFSWNKKKKWGWPVLRASPYSQELPSNLRRGMVYTIRIPVQSSVLSIES
ncbi:ASCH domain-containing protein [bacterium]|nr:ASCH domain-containing protein [bacterium]